MDDPQGIAPAEASTHIGDGLKQLADETADLPGGRNPAAERRRENTAGLGGSGIGLDALQALRNRRLPVHTIGFGKEEPGARCGD